jgi:O-antigen ligase
MIMTLPFLIYLLRFAQNNLLRGVWFLSIVIVLYNILLTNTRATMVGALAALLLSGVFRLYPIKPWRLIAVGMLALLLIPLTPNTVIRRALSYANYTYTQSATLRARVAFWQAWGKVAREHWLTGIGLGDDITLSKYYDQSELPPRMSVHNHFLATFMELGLFGWMLFMAFLGSVFWSTQKAIRFFRNRPADHPQHVFLLGCQVCFFTLLLYGLQCDVFYMPLKGWWLIVGLSHSLYLQARREPSWAGTQPST